MEGLDRNGMVWYDGQRYWMNLELVEWMNVDRQMANGWMDGEWWDNLEQYNRELVIIVICFLIIEWIHTMDDDILMLGSIFNDH